MAELKKVKVTPEKGVTLRGEDGKKVPFGKTIMVLETTAKILVKNKQVKLVTEKD